MILLMSNTLHAQDWMARLEKYKPIIENQTFDQEDENKEAEDKKHAEAFAIISRQCQTFLEGSAPAIAAPQVKSIPIIECQDPIVNLYDMKHPRVIVMAEQEMLLKAHAHPDDIDPRADSHPCMRKKVFEILLQMIIELDILAVHFGYETGDLDIYLFEGWRDLDTQKLLFDRKMAQIREANPDFTEEQAYAETSKWLSPYIDNVPAHSTAGAIDIHIYNNKTQQFLDMGPFNKDGTKAPTFSDDPSLQDHQKNNRLLLLAAATRAGLTNYVYEFWHYSYGDRYDCFWRKDKQDPKYHAIYGSK